MCEQALGGLMPVRREPEAVRTRPVVPLDLAFNLAGDASETAICLIIDDDGRRSSTRDPMGAVHSRRLR